MDVRLVVEKNRKRLRTYSLRNEETIIGRRKDCDLRIPSAEVSRRHCVLSTQAGYLTAEDLDSANGTLVNGQAITGRQVVRPGDRLTVGPVTFVVEYQLTQTAIDRLLAGDDGSYEDGDIAEAIVEGEEEPVAPIVDDEEVPLPAVFDGEIAPLALEEFETDQLPMDMDAPLEEEIPEAVVEMDDNPNWKMPEADELRNLLNEMEDAKKPRRPKP